MQSTSPFLLIVTMWTSSTIPTCQLFGLVSSLSTHNFSQLFTCDHRILKIELPVRSAVLKQDTGGLVVRWVTTSESPLLYVFVFRCWAAGLLVCMWWVDVFAR
jgi:hypothetical protein